MKKNICKKLLFFCILIVGVFFLFILPTYAAPGATCTGDADCSDTPGSLCMDLGPKSGKKCSAGTTSGGATQAACCVGTDQCIPAKTDTNCSLYNKGTTTYKLDKQECNKITACTKLTQPKTEDTYKFIPTEPKLQINIPTVQFSKITEEGAVIDVPYLAEYVAGVYKYAVGIGSIIAIVMLMVGGLTYLTSGGSATRVSKAKEIISGAAIGLILLLGSYLVLYTINPDLVTFKQLKVKLVKREVLDIVEDVSNDPLILNAKTACKTIDECKKLCAKDSSEWPDAITGMASPQEVKTISSMTGIKPQNKEIKSKSGVITALQSVGTVAAQKGYKIQINDGFRPLKDQIKKVCDKITAGKESDVGVTVSWPGGSRHGMGIAVDVALIKGGKTLTATDMTDELIRELEELMRKGGFVRYCTEWWHFEIGTAGSSCRPPSGLYCPRPYDPKKFEQMKCKFQYIK